MTATLTIAHHSVFEYLSELSTDVEGRITRNVIGCASKLLEYFYSWKRWKRNTHRTEWFYQPLRRIVEDLKTYGIESVRKAILFLMDLGAIKRRTNPRNCQDKTYQYKLSLPESVVDALHKITSAVQGKDERTASLLVDAGLAVEVDNQLRLTAKITEVVSFFCQLPESENRHPGSKSRSSESENRQHLRDLTNIPPESPKPFSSPLPPRAVEPEEEKGEEETLEAEVVEEPAPTQSPRKTPEPALRQEIQLWEGTQSSGGALNGSTKHPALVYSGEDTPWLEEPSRRNARFGRPQWNQAFLEWGGQRFAQKFGKADRFEAMGDFRVALENNPDKILTRWEEYEGHMGAALQNVADRAAAGVTLDDKDRAKLEKHHRAVANTQVQVPVPQPVLADVAEVAHDRRVESVDWDRIGRETDEAISVEFESVVEPVAPPVVEPVAEPPKETQSEYSTPSQFKEMMGNLMKSFSGRSLSRPAPSPVEVETPLPSADTDIVARAIASNDPILLNDAYVKKQLLNREVLGLISLEKNGDSIVAVNDEF